MNALDIYKVLKSKNIIGWYNCEYSSTGYTPLQPYSGDSSPDIVEARVDWTDKEYNIGYLNINFWNSDNGEMRDLYYPVENRGTGFEILNTETSFNWEEVLKPKKTCTNILY